MTGPSGDSPRRPSARPAILLGAALAFVTLFAAGVRADDPDPPSPPKADPPDAGGETFASCIEHVPEGATRPKITETFPSRGLSGYASSLEITIKHGKGETVLPQGFKVQTASDAGKALSAAGFVLPDPDGGSPPSITREEATADGLAVTKLVIPFVPLPKEAGRNEMTLPAVPIALARASGDIVTVCTKPHAIRVEDPTANEPEPKVKPNAPPRQQREDWALARQVAIGTLIGVVLSAIAFWLYRVWKRRPKEIKLPPPRLPWLVALEELYEIRTSSLLEDGNTGEYYDRVSNSVRKYLGARYGFDGLEATTDEMRNYLYRVRPPISSIAEIMRFLEECDLVKFARVVPTNNDCTEALDRGEGIVRTTIPPAHRKEAA